MLSVMPAAASKKIFLTGASSGIGRATAERLTQRGHQVWATARDPGRLPALAGLHPLAMDLADAASIESAWRRAVAEAGAIDGVIQNAGSGICGAIEDVTPDDAQAVWRVLVEGPLRVLQLAAAHLRPRRAGLIIGVSSLAAELPISFGAHYSAGKAALSSLLAGLAMELKPFGVQVVDLRPGDLRTSFNDALRPIVPEGSAYAPWVAAAWKRSCELMESAPPADLAARAILRLLEQKNPPPVMRCGSFFQATIGPLGPRLLPQAWLLDSIRGYFHLGPVDEGERGR